MPHARLLRRTQQSRGAVDEHFAVAVGGVDDHLDAVERDGEATAVAQVDGEARRAPGQHTHLVPAALELARRLGADDSGSTHDRDSHDDRTNQWRAM